MLCRLAVVVCLFSHIFAVPTSERLSIQQFNARAASPNCALSTTTSSPFRRIRDSIIEKIWSVPNKKDCRIRAAEIRNPTSGRQSRRYEDDVVLRFNISSSTEARAFSEASNVLYLDIWDATSDWIDIRIARRVLPSLLELLPSSLHNAHTLLIHDLAQAIDSTYPSSGQQAPWTAEHTLTAGEPSDIFFHNYQPLSIITPWMKLLARESEGFAEIIIIGVSAEGRDILALRIRSPGSTLDPNQPRQTILITAGSHGREWISVSTSTYIIHSLISRLQFPSAEDHQALRFLKHFDIIFVPVLNPDGYAYTWTTDRLWRKTRQSTSLPFCPGIDLDRAFPFAWDGTTESDNPCTDTYAGTNPLEAIEAKALTDWITTYTTNNNATIKAYIDLHSYSQQILFPYSHTCSTLPHNFEDLLELALGLSKSLRSVHGGAFYSVSPACQITDDTTNDTTITTSTSQSSSIRTPAGGSALDYLYHDVGAKYAFQIKLRDQGSYGFLVPRSEIVPSGKEAVSAVLGLGAWLLGDRGIESSVASPHDSSSSSYDDRSRHDGDDGDNSNSNSDSDDDDEGQVESTIIDDDDDDEGWERVFDPDFKLDLRRR